MSKSESVEATEIWVGQVGSIGRPSNMRVQFAPPSPEQQDDGWGLRQPDVEDAAPQVCRHGKPVGADCGLCDLGGPIQSAPVAVEVWEYKLETSTGIGVDECLAQGRDGWRVCAVSGSTWVFGRPVHAQSPAASKCNRCGRGGRSEENGDGLLCMDCAGEEVNAAVNHACRAPGIGIVAKGRVFSAFDMLRKQVERIREKCIENAAEFSDSASSEDHANARLCKVITGLVDAAERDAMGWIDHKEPEQ